MPDDNTSTAEQDVTTETGWAVKWSPAAALIETGAKPPWTANYARWCRSPNAVVYRQTTTTTVTVEVSEWTGTSDA